MLSPLFVGVFEFSMMRTGDNLNMKTWGKMFHEYMHDGAPFKANFSWGEQTSISRALPHGEAIGDHVEMLEIFARSRTFDLVLEADNVQKRHL